MIFDATINLGQIITFAGLIIGGAAALAAMRGDVNTLKADVRRLDDEMRKQTEILVTLGRYDERLTVMQHQIADLALTSKALAAENAILRSTAASQRNIT